MPHLSIDATDEELLQLADSWAALLEGEDYLAAFNYTAHDPHMRWSPDLIRQVIQSYDECKPGQRVTLHGRATDIQQRKEVSRWPEPRHGSIGEIWYDLNIDGCVSDLTATFDILTDANGLTIQLNDIHVM